MSLDVYMHKIALFVIQIVHTNVCFILGGIFKERIMLFSVKQSRD